jgi:DNA primase large subunit
MSCGTKRKAVQIGVQKKSKVAPSLGVVTAEQAAEKAAEQQQTHFVNLYKERPQGEISLEQFERCANDRKRVLQGIDEAQAKGVQWKDMPEYIQNLLRQYMPEPRSAAEVEEARATDHVSHFILRMAYSRTAELRKWFVRQEEVLLRYRFNRADETARRECLDGMQAIDEQEFSKFAPELRAVFGWRDVCQDAERQQFFKDEAEPWTLIYKVPFEEVADLVRYRRVFMRAGWAYMLSSDAASVVATSFRQRLTRASLICSEHYAENVENQEDERLAGLLPSLTQRPVGLVYGSAEQLPLAELPAAMEASAPPCMRRSFAVLRAEHHLKHGGRLQLGLFFKGIGLSMEDALVFWRAEFMQGGKTAEEFEKQYTYNFKHQYGQAGSRINYSPYACGAVINASPDTSGQTGCPFRNCKVEGLTSMLRGMKVQEDVVANAVGLRQEQRYQLACSAVFEAVHGKKLEVTAPHQYFAESRKHYAEKEQGEEETDDSFTQG